MVCLSHRVIGGWSNTILAMRRDILRKTFQKKKKKEGKTQNNVWVLWGNSLRSYPVLEQKTMSNYHDCLNKDQDIQLNKEHPMRYMTFYGTLNDFHLTRYA